jgi:hypothetical protein
VAKANLVLPNGTNVLIEGTSEEVAQLLATVTQGESANRSERKKKKRSTNTPRQTQNPNSVAALISQLAREDYFKSKRSLGEIQKKLEELGHIYPITTISPCLTRMTKRRVLRRLKQDRVWVYVN